MFQTHRSPSRVSTRTGSFLLLALTLMTLQFSVAVPGAQAAPKPKPSSISLVPTITSINLVNGNLVASGFVTATIKGTTTTVPFTAPVNISLAPNQMGATDCPILDLTLGPINLNLLGLVVQTSPICLTVSGTPGDGLGGLLCQLGNLLNGGLSLSQILQGLGLDLIGLPGLSPAQITALLSGLTDLFNQAIAQVFSVVPTVTHIGQGHTCAILHLALGPIDLTLLGLNVHLDNCANGPVTVDITAVTGQGNLLGNLLCQLVEGGLPTGLTLGQIIDLILSLLNQ